jgi:hypothetical protein
MLLLITCSLVCKTCLDYKHVCLGYSESPTHVRTHSGNASQTPSLAPLTSASERTNSRTVKSPSPDGASQYKQTVGSGLDRHDHLSSQDALVSRETPLSKIRESEQHATGASPESSTLYWRSLTIIGITGCVDSHYSQKVGPP